MSEGQAVGVHSTAHVEHADWQLREKLRVHVVEGVPPHPDGVTVILSIVPVVAEHHAVLWGFMSTTHFEETVQEAQEPFGFPFC